MLKIQNMGRNWEKDTRIRSQTNGLQQKFEISDNSQLRDILITILEQVPKKVVI